MITLFDRPDLIRDAPVARCRSCGADIKWVRTEDADKRMPLDVKPVTVIVATSSTRDGTPVARTVRSYVSHFATCPDALNWKGGYTPEEPS